MIFKNDDKSEDATEKFNYIATTDKETAQMLRDLGYEEISTEQNRWVFKNK